MLENCTKERSSKKQGAQWGLHRCHPISHLGAEFDNQNRFQLKMSNWAVTMDRQRPLDGVKACDRMSPHRTPLLHNKLLVFKGRKMIYNGSLHFVSFFFFFFNFVSNEGAEMAIIVSTWVQSYPEIAS